MTERYGVIERTTVSAVTAVMSTTMALPPKRDFFPQFPVRVCAIQDLTPAFTRITLAGAELATLERLGADEYFGLLMPPAGVPLHMPANHYNPRTALAKMPAATRPELRWYTIRTHRPDAGEIDVDIVNVGHDGPGSRWVAQARVGDEVGLRVQTAPYGSAPATGRHLLIGDETALPGILAILDAHRTDTQRRFHIFVEVPSADYLPADVNADAAIQVAFRGDQLPGTALLPLLEDAAIPELDYAWLCAEARTVAAGRRHLVKQRGLNRRRILASGFWKLGQARL